jgi:hypothetical protein
LDFSFVNITGGPQKRDPIPDGVVEAGHIGEVRGGGKGVSRGRQLIVLLIKVAKNLTGNQENLTTSSALIVTYFLSVTFVISRPKCVIGTISLLIDMLI